jgi:ubiquinone/menaquinone biosynthesis C-methylase UbiE
MKHASNPDLGYDGSEWDMKIRDKNNPNFWKYGVANLVFLDSLKGKTKIIDIGCGTGGSSIFLADREQRDYIVGIDPIKSMIKVAKQRAIERGLNQKIDFVVCDGRLLPFKKSCFDALVSRGDAFVFLVPQKMALLEFKRVLKSGAVLAIEIDNQRWDPGKPIFFGFEKMRDGAIAYSVEHFDAKRNHTKVFYVLSPDSLLMKQISKKREFAKSKRLQQYVTPSELKKETIEIRYGGLTHWPTAHGLRMLFRKGGFENIEILGDGLLMGLLLDGDQRIMKILRKYPDILFSIEQKLIPYVDPRKAHTIILKATIP